MVNRTDGQEWWDGQHGPLKLDIRVAHVKGHEILGSASLVETHRKGPNEG